MDSVLSQNTKYHILQTIVNDGSPDHSRDILSKYEHLPNVEIINQENQGFSGARNAGLKVIKVLKASTSHSWIPMIYSRLAALMS